jgi:hypothetical protein
MWLSLSDPMRRELIADLYVFLAVTLFLIISTAIMKAVVQRGRPRLGPLSSSPSSTEEICPRCGGTRRLITPDGAEWPCPDNTYRHVEPPSQE